MASPGRLSPRGRCDAIVPARRAGARPRSLCRGVEVVQEADELWAGGGGAVRDSGTVHGSEFGETRQFMFVEVHRLVDARVQVVTRHRAVQLQQRGLDRFGDRRGQPRMTVQDQMAVQAADPPQQNRWQRPFTGLLAVRLDPTVVRTGHRTQREDLPRTGVDEPVDVPVRMTVDEHRAPVLRM